MSRRTFGALSALFKGAGNVAGEYQKQKQREGRVQRLQEVLGADEDLAQYADFIDPYSGELDPFAATLMKQDFATQNLAAKQAMKEALLDKRLGAQRDLYAQKHAFEKDLLDYKKQLGYGAGSTSARTQYSPLEKARQKQAEKFLTNLDYQQDYLGRLGYEDEIPYSPDEIAQMILSGQRIPQAPEEPGFMDNVGNFFGGIGNLFGGSKEPSTMQRTITPTQQNTGMGNQELLEKQKRLIRESVGVK